MLSKKVIAAVVVVIVVLVASVSVYVVLNMQENAKPKVKATYNGENTAPSGIPSDFPMHPAGFSTPYYYCFNITVLNLDTTQGINTPLDDVLRSLIPKYPQFSTWTPPGADKQAVFTDVRSYSPTHQDRTCIAIFTTSQLTSEQVDSLTADLNAQLEPTVIAWYA
jgi:hypothetical protein